MSENTPENVSEENPGQENPGSEEAAESPALDGYGNDTGFADEAEDPRDAQDLGSARDPE